MRGYRGDEGKMKKKKKRKVAIGWGEKVEKMNLVECEQREGR